MVLSNTMYGTRILSSHSLSETMSLFLLKHSDKNTLSSSPAPLLPINQTNQDLSLFTQSTHICFRCSSTSPHTSGNLKSIHKLHHHPTSTSTALPHDPLRTVSMASNHLSTHFDMTDFHEQQLNHYRKKGTADLQQRRAERQAARTDKALPPAPPTIRRPVPPPIPSPLPARRPVPPSRRTEASPAESHGYSYQPYKSQKTTDRESAGLEMATKHLGELKTHNRSASPGPRSSTSRQRTYTPAPPSPRGRPQTPDRVRRIVRDSSGRFDERNVVEDHVHRYPVLDPRRPVTPPHLIEQSSYIGLDPNRPTTPLSERSRPGSSSSSRPGSASSFLSKTFSWGSRPGTPTGKSPSSTPKSSASHPRKPRCGSFKDAVARVSSGFSRGKDIVTLNAHDRERWMADERARINRETEQRRRERPETRPKYQRDFIAASRYSNNRRIVPPPAPFSTSTTVGAIDNAADSAQPISLSSPVREAALDWTSRHKNYDYDADEDRARPVPLNTGTKTAVTLSKITDWVKPKRKDSAGSEMSFADCVPEGVLEACSRCGQAVSGKGFLTRGLCRGCYQRRLNGK